MRRWRTGAAIFILAGCSTGLPPIPHLSPDRQAVEAAYAEVLAKPRDAQANGRLGMALQAFGYATPAEACYRRARAFDRKDARWAYYLGWLQSRHGDHREASANLKDAGSYLPAMLLRAQMLLHLGSLTESQETLRTILKDQPHLAPAYYWLGRVESAKGLPGVAQEQYRKALELWPGYASARQELDSARLGGQTIVGDPVLDDPLLDRVDAIANPALTHWLHGALLEKTGRWRQAIPEYEEAVRQNPQLARAHASLIALYTCAHQPEKAAAEYRAAVRLEPNRPQVHYEYGAALAKRGLVSEAKAAFRKALEISPKYAEAHDQLGALAEERGNLDEAFAQYQEAYEEKPSLRQAQYHLGKLLLNRKQASIAIALLAQALWPDDADTTRYMFTLAQAYVAAGDAANADSYMQQAAARAAARGQAQLRSEIEAALHLRNH